MTKKVLTKSYGTGKVEKFVLGYKLCKFNGGSELHVTSGEFQIFHLQEKALNIISVSGYIIIASCVFSNGIVRI